MDKIDIQEGNKYRNFTAKEKAWIKQFERVMKKAPDTLFLFVGEGVSVYAKDENNHRYMGEEGGVDGKANHVGIITDMECDGGAY